MNAILDGLIRLWKMSGREYRYILELDIQKNKPHLWADFQKEVYREARGKKI